MALVPLKCTGCGAAIEADDNLETAVCPYCRMHFLIKQPEPVQTIVVSAHHEDDFEIVAGVLHKYKGAATEVVIPDGVIEIANGAFYGLSRITSVVVPDSVRTIGSKHFKMAELGCFHGCTSLKRINIPDTVENIGNNSPFFECKNLSDFVISTEKLMSLNRKELQYGLGVFADIYPFSEGLLQRIKQECKSKGLCWYCRKPLVLDKKGRCESCKRGEQL